MCSSQGLWDILFSSTYVASSWVTTLLNLNGLHMIVNKINWSKTESRTLCAGRSAWSCSSGGSGCQMPLPTWGRLASSRGRKLPPTQSWETHGFKRLTDPKGQHWHRKEAGLGWIPKPPSTHLFIPNDPHLPNLPDSALEASLIPPYLTPITIQSTGFLHHRLKIASNSPFTCPLWLTCWKTLVRDPCRVPPCMFKVNTTSWSTVLTSFPCWKTFTAY